MTIDEIKNKLPSVKVKLPNGKIETCILSGRKLGFAMVTIPTGGNFEVSWNTVKHCIDNNKAITY